MATLKRTCPECGAPGESQVGQFVRHDERLVWNEGFRCHECGFQIECDGSGIPEPSIRDAIIHQAGLWAWAVHETGSRLLKTLLELRTRLGLNVVDVAAIKKHAPGVLAVGTQAEMHWLKMLGDRHKLQSELNLTGPGNDAPLDLLDHSIAAVIRSDAVFVGLEPLELTAADLRTVDECPLKWRSTDARYAVLPPDMLDRINSLTPAAAFKADRRARRFHDANEIPFSEGLFGATEMLNFAGDASAVNAWLAARILEDEPVIVSWDTRTAVLTSATLFRQYWDDFCHPGSDDVEVWPLHESWALLFHHEEMIFFARRK